MTKLIKAILDEKGRAVRSIEADQSVKNLIDVLANGRIGAAIVLRDGDLCGIVSERDIVRALHVTGPKLLEASVESIMTANPEVCSENDSSDDVMERMTRGRFRHMPVCEGTKLEGMVSIGDVVKARIEVAEAEKEAVIAYMQQ